MMTKINEKELRYLLALYRAPKLSHINYLKLLNHFHTAEAIFNANKHSLKQLGVSEPTIQYLAQPNWQAVDHDLKWSELGNHHIIAFSDSNYPSLLKQIHNPPPLLFVIGDPKILNQLQLAMVGSRNPSHTGKEIAYQLAMQLAQSGLCISSGLAIGIDGASHRGALSVGGLTIAVLANGLRSIYPARHQQLAEEIAEKGALVSELPLEFQPRANYFPQRNRIISGLSLGTLVVEATFRSGSLITARLAAEQGREVFAIPGSIQNPLSKGCNSLIQQGAKLIETAADVLEEFTQLPLMLTKSVATSSQNTPDPKLDGTHRKLLECIGFEVTSIDKLVVRSGLSVREVSSKLLILELHGYIRLTYGGYIRVK